MRFQPPASHSLKRTHYPSPLPFALRHPSPAHGDRRRSSAGREANHRFAEAAGERSEGLGVGAILLPRILVLCYNCNMQQMQHATNAGEPNESPRQHILTDQTVPANDNPSAEATAAVVLDVVPLVMRTIRMRMREARAADLSVPQFRALAHLKKHPGVSLSDVAEYVGLTLPAASRMMDGLVARGYAERRLSAISRRSIELRLSAKGLEMLDVTLQHTRQALAEL